MIIKYFSFRLALLLVVAVTPLMVTSCASTDSEDNASARPWNAPRGWENGLPSGMTEGGRYGR